MSLTPGVPEEYSGLAAMLSRAEESADRGAAHESTPEVVAARRRRRTRRLVITGSVALVIAAVVGTYIPVTMLAPVRAVGAATIAPEIQVPAAMSLTLPDFGASAISVMGAERFPGTVGVDGILAASGGNGPRPIASITKLITALVILDATPIPQSGPEPTVVFTEADVDLYDAYYVRQATVWPLKAGAVVPLRDALRVMLVASATNYADALTTRTFGSHAAFRVAARKWLDANGFTGTTVVEPTGLDPRNLSTPTDLIAIGKLAMANPVVATLVGTSALFGEGGAGWPNTNTLLGVDGVNGIKTGTLDEAGACLLFSATVDVGNGLQVSVVGVVLGGFNHVQVNDAVRTLLKGVKAGFHDVPVLTAGQELGTYATVWGEEASVVAAEDASVFTWSDMPVDTTVTIDDLAVAGDGDVVGEARFSSGDEVVVVPLELKGELVGPDGWWRLTHPGEMLGG